MKIYYSDTVLPIGYRPENDEELKTRFVEILKILASNINENSTSDTINTADSFLDNFFNEFGCYRMAIPLKEGEKVMYCPWMSTPIEMEEAHKLINET